METNMENNVYINIYVHVYICILESHFHTSEINIVNQYASIK